MLTGCPVSMGYPCSEFAVQNGTNTGSGYGLSVYKYILILRVLGLNGSRERVNNHQLGVTLQKGKIKILINRPKASLR